MILWPIVPTQVGLHSRSGAPSAPRKRTPIVRRSRQRRNFLLGLWRKRLSKELIVESSQNQTILGRFRDAPKVASYLISRSNKTSPHFRLWHIAAPDVCDGTSAVSESRHRIPGASVGQPTEPCLGCDISFVRAGVRVCPTISVSTDSAAAGSRPGSMIGATTVSTIHPA